MQDENAPRDAALPLRLAVVLLIAVTQVGATQLTSRVQRGLSAPFAITWCHACLQILCWPAGNARRTPTTDALNRSDLAIFPLLFLGANYAYVRALALASPLQSARPWRAPRPGGERETPGRRARSASRAGRSPAPLAFGSTLARRVVTCEI